MNNFILYIKTGCFWCEKVTSFAHEQGIQLDLRNIAEKGVAEELIARGGKRQVPYLVNRRNAIEMYESADIIQYLEKDTS
jgi:glutaredoxin